MSLDQEETEVYTAFPRAVATALNFFSLFSFEFDDESNQCTIRFTSCIKDTLSEEKGRLLQEYVKQKRKDLRKGTLVKPSLIQRHMYWFVSKLLEFGLFPTNLYRVMSFYQISICELDEA